MPDTWIPPTAADTPTLYPPEPEPDASSWLTWIPAPESWNAAPTMLLPPPKLGPPIPIPEGVFLIPTELLPPPMMEPAAPREPSAIPPPPRVGPIAASAPAPAPACASASASASVPTPLPLDLFPVERVARLDAALALAPENAPRILDTHQLDPATWIALRQHCQTALRAALRDGDPAPLRAYDVAFVAELERVRGPIAASQHAELVQAAARGRRSEAFARLGLPHLAALAIERVMVQRACATR
ncbi:hypothetical protein [Polyangium fumosum]|uniref:Uncharacterized protein n=1 Tax=Polyangium fumosum TaxID=889272 RepID=A0A4V5PS76_9BACT|nr:hypothetical protein [Polyangium fumosum]TKD06646.1 hypothetical protein E8A74_19275 [Polyangium fumosum]